MSMLGSFAARMLLGVFVLLVAAVYADTNVTILDTVETTVTIQDHEVQAVSSLGNTTSWPLSDPGRVTIGCSSGNLITISISSDDGYVQNLQIHYGQAEELYNATNATDRSPRIDLKIEDNGLSGLTNLSVLTLLGVNFSSPKVTLVLPDTISFIEISASTVEDLSFTVSDISSLKEIVLWNNALSTLPKFFYEREYPQEQVNISLEWMLPDSVELPDEYFANLKANIGKFTGWNNYLTLRDSCYNTTNNYTYITTVVCNNGEHIAVESGSLSVDEALGSNAAGDRCSVTVALTVAVLVATLTMVNHGLL